MVFYLDLLFSVCMFLLFLIYNKVYCDVVEERSATTCSLPCYAFCTRMLSLKSSNSTSVPPFSATTISFANT